MIPARVPLAGLPISLILIPHTADIAFVVTQPFSTIYDCSTKGVDVYIDMSCISIDGNNYDYNTTYCYKEIPELLSWIRKQDLLLEEITLL